MKTRFSLGALLFCLFAPLLPAHAATFVVTSTADSGAGSLNDAVAQANANAVGSSNTISFNLPSGPQRIVLSRGTIDIRSRVSIVGPGASLLTVDGNQQAYSPVFTFSQNDRFVESSISGLTITGGTGHHERLDAISSIGGGIYDLYQGLSISNCVLTGNSASSGGGGIGFGGSGSQASLTVSNCTITGNTAVNSGAGIFFDSSGSLTVQNSTISNNSGGGGIGAGGTGTLTNCAVSGNSGGGINGTNISLSNCTVSGNTNGSGAGGARINGTSTIRNCTFSDNTSSGGPNVSGGIFLDSSSSLSLGNTILNNSGGNIAKRDNTATISDEGYNLSSDGANSFLTAPSDKINTDPKLGPLRFNGGPTQTMALLAGSPAINAGNSSLSTDGRGFTRPVQFPGVPNAAGGNGSDIGAFEKAVDSPQSGSNLVVNTSDDHDDGACSVQDCSLREAIRLAPASGTISFDSNVFGMRQTIVLNGAALPTISRDLTINGPSAGVGIDGGGIPNLFTVVSPRSGSSNPTRTVLSLSGLSLSGASVAINDGGMVVFSNGQLSGNGTGLFVNPSFGATVRDSFIQSNGTGIQNAGSLLVQGVTASGNTDFLISHDQAVSILSISTIEGNGNGIQNAGEMSVSNSILAFNGDAIRDEGINANVSIFQNTFVGNTNALINNGGTANIVSNTISGNGGGLINRGGTLNVNSTISAGNGTNVSGALASNKFNVLSGIASEAGLDTDGNGYPRLQNNGGPTATVALVSAGSAVNGADFAITGGTDQRGSGFPRVQKGRADIGAFESNLSVNPASYSLVVTTPQDEDNGNPDPALGSGTSLREAMNAANLNGGATISFDPNVFASRQRITLNRSALPTVTGNLSINGPSAGVEIAGGGTPNIFTVVSPQDSFPNRSETTLSLSRLSLSGASVAINDSGNVLFSNGQLRGNGMGLLVKSNFNATVRDSFVQSNGTGINNAGLLFASRVNGSGNTDFLINTGGASLQTMNIVSNGNGIQSQGQVLVSDSTFAFNGDALRQEAGVGTTLLQNTFVGNSNAVLIRSQAGVYVNLCTISGNGGGLINQGGSLHVNSTISAGNGTNVSGALASNTFNILGGIASQAGLDTDSNGYPRLRNNGGPTATVALVAGSPAINAGDPQETTGDNDQRGTGFSRVVGGRADIGAFEFGASGQAVKQAPSIRRAALPSIRRS